MAEVAEIGPVRRRSVAAGPLLAVKVRSVVPPAVVLTVRAEAMVAVPLRVALAVSDLLAPRAMVPPVRVGVPSWKVRFPEACVPLTVTV